MRERSVSKDGDKRRCKRLEQMKLSPEEEFEQATQAYVRACAEWKTAITRYVRDVGQDAAMPKLEEAHDRICHADSVLMSQEEIALRAARARPVVDSDK